MREKLRKALSECGKKQVNRMYDVAAAPMILMFAIPTVIIAVIIIAIIIAVVKIIKGFIDSRK